MESQDSQRESRELTIPLYSEDFQELHELLTKVRSSESLSEDQEDLINHIQQHLEAQ